MPSEIRATLARTLAGTALGTVGLAACATSPMQTASSYASTGAHATYNAASTGAHAVYATGGDVYSGVGTAAKKPFRDLNMMQDPIPPVLIRSESQPYDTVGLDSCDAILNRVAELDLALGPDLDSPKDRKRGRTARAATLAAAAALDAASSAAEGFLPMRSVIKEVSGATRYEDHVKHAVLAGTVRRAFLKAVGMQHNCGWPAAPLGFQPAVVAIATAPLAVPSPVAAPRLYATAGARPSYPGPSAYLTAGREGRPAPGAPHTVAATPAAPLSLASSLDPVQVGQTVASTAPAWSSEPAPATAVSQVPSPAPQPVANSFSTTSPSPSVGLGAPWGGPGASR